MPLDFNDTLMTFIPKGEEELDEKEVVRSPESTRPLGLKNSDNKLIAAVTNGSLKRGVSGGACEVQRGFIQGRNFVNNIIELDAWSRAYAGVVSLFFPLLACFDFGSAFPSLIHAWLFIAMQAAGVPHGAFHLIESLYHVVSAFGRISGSSSRFLFLILSGVIQGCPLAGTCFVIAIDAFLRKFYCTIEEKGLGCIRACADDIGAALKSITVLPLLATVFQEAEMIAGLTLKIKKTVFVPLNVVRSPQVVIEIKGWLQAHVPRWKDVQVAACARYLGAHLGPQACEAMWQSPLSKWISRTLTIAASGLPTGVGIELYHTRSLTTLSYISQFALLPGLAFSRERALLGKLLHFPGNTLAASDYFSMSKWGSYPIRSVLAYSIAVLMRSALVTHQSWKAMHSMLKEQAEKNIDLHQLIFNGSFSPRFWDSLSICEVMHAAARGFPNHKRLSDAGCAALEVHRDMKDTCPKYPNGVQTALYNKIVEVLFHDSIPNLLSRRMPVLSAGEVLPQGFDFETLRSCICKLPPYIVFVLIRTWANGWTTSYRMHEPQLLPCVFGCPQQNDSLQHYLCCERLWRALKTALRKTSSTVPPILVRAPILSKLALMPASRENVVCICAITHTYHTIKHNYRTTFAAYLHEQNAEAVAQITVDILTSALGRFEAML